MSQPLDDPYQPPTLSEEPGVANVDSEVLRNVAFWQRFFSILGYGVTGLAMVVIVAQVIAASTNSMARPGAATGAVVSSIAVLAVILLVYLIPAMRLGAAAKATRDLGEGRISLGQYAHHQRAFWRYSGMMISTILVIYLFFVVVLLMSGLSAFRFR